MLQEEQVVRVEEQAMREAVWEEECRRQREETKNQLPGIKSRFKVRSS